MSEIIIGFVLLGALALAIGFAVWYANKADQVAGSTLAVETLAEREQERLVREKAERDERERAYEEAKRRPADAGDWARAAAVYAAAARLLADKNR